MAKSKKSSLPRRGFLKGAAVGAAPAGIAFADGVPGAETGGAFAARRSSSLAYGSTGGFRGPGASNSLESISTQPAGMPRRRYAVPRKSVMSPMVSPASSRRAIAPIWRSALPYTRRSAFESTNTERRTCSDQ